MQNIFTQFATLNKGKITFSYSDNAEGTEEMTEARIASVKRIMNRVWKEEEPRKEKLEILSLTHQL